MPIVPIKSFEELKKILAIQKAISDQARKEIMEHADGSLEDFVSNSVKVLEKYTRYPTLTEYQLMPHLSDAGKWGATFGVTTILAVLVLNHAKAFLGGTPDNAPVLFVEFLEKLRDVKSKSIVMDDLTKAFAVLSEAYGMVYVQGDALALTVTGSRALLHALDANMFIDETAKALAEMLPTPNIA